MANQTTAAPRVDVHLTGDDLRAALRSDAERGLRSTPKDIPPKWFYDTRGSQLFDDITRLPEYYPTRRERAILEAHASEIAEVTRADTLVELGSGTSEKTRILLDAFRDAGTITRFVPFDVSEQTLRDAAAAVNLDYPAVAVHAVVGDFEHHLGSIPGGGRRLVAFLGGTIGNLLPPARAEFLLEISKGLGLDDHVLLGLDLVKDVDRLEAAYDDAPGRHRRVQQERAARHEPRARRRLRRRADSSTSPSSTASTRASRCDYAPLDAHTVEVRALGLEVQFAAGEEMRTEVSAKFTREQVAEELESAGMHLVHWWTDPDGDFALLLARPA